MEFYDFPETVGNVILPTDFHSFIFQRGSEKPPAGCSMAIYSSPERLILFRCSSCAVSAGPDLEMAKGPPWMDFFSQVHMGIL
jgi:hypothetical protein